MTITIEVTETMLRHLREIDQHRRTSDELIRSYNDGSLSVDDFNTQFDVVDRASDIARVHLAIVVRVAVVRSGIDL